MEDVKSNTEKSDPTFLTTAAVTRESAALKELIFTRLDAIEKAIQVAHNDLVRVPTDVQKQVGNLKELHEEKFKSFEKQLEEQSSLKDEKFAGVQKQFIERDTRTDETSKNNKVAIDAALNAQKESATAQNESNSAAIGKSEAATIKQIDGIMALLNSGLKGTDEKIADLKSRIDRGEGKSTGHSDFWGYIIGAIGLVGGIVGIAVAFLKH